ncbi:MAG: winged helix-turn-helix transcriptional regulator [Nitrososphaerota archaeon]
MKTFIMLAILLLASQPATVLITIDSSGVVEAHLRLNVVEGLNEVRLPAEPIPETIEVKVGGEYAVAIYENQSLYFFSPIAGEAEITYLVNVSARDSIFSFSIVYENLTRLRVPPQIILLAVPRNIEKMEYAEGDLVIEFYGPEVIEYAVRTGAIARPTITATLTTEEATTTTGAETLLRTTQATGTQIFEVAERPGAQLIDQAIIIGAIALPAIAALAAIIYSRSRRREGFAEDRSLTKLDRMILEAIENAGGSILQGDLQAALGLPKTTLWRHVRKLGKLGYLEIVKEGSLNRLILVRRPS